MQKILLAASLFFFSMTALGAEQSPYVGVGILSGTQSSGLSCDEACNNSVSTGVNIIGGHQTPYGDVEIARTTLAKRVLWQIAVVGEKKVGSRVGIFAGVGVSINKTAPIFKIGISVKITDGFSMRAGFEKSKLSDLPHLGVSGVYRF